LSGFALAAPDVVAAMKVTDKRATEEAVVKAVGDKKAANKRITVKVKADKEATDKRTAEEAVRKEVAVGAVGDSSAPGQAPSLAAGARRVAAPSGSTPPAKRPYMGCGNLGLSSFLVFFFFLLVAMFHSKYFSFLHISPIWRAKYRSGFTTLPPDLL
jgi:hypothetical protein